jgi:glycosyltransferase involved in cell wall biosynthesis
MLTKEDEVITFVSRELEPYRGYHILMRALPLLLSKRPNAKVLIVGGNGTAYGQKAATGTSWAELFARAAHSQIGEEAWKRVHFLGKISYEHYLSVLQLSSAHIYLTYPFVLSWSLMEAMSVGCAVVASDTGPVQELIEDGKTGLLTPFFDVEGLVARVDCVLSDRKLAQALGNEARNWIIQRYDLSSVSAPRQVEWLTSLA